MPKVYVQKREESHNFSQIKGEAMGFSHGVSQIVGGRSLISLATSLSSLSPLAEVLRRYRLLESPALCPPLVCTPLLVQKRKKNKLFMILLSLCCLALGSGIYHSLG